MKVLVIGSGGREHAITYALSKSNKVTDLYVMPGNPGTAAIATNVPGSVTDLDGITKFVQEHQIDLTVIGPEDPLCMGLADRLSEYCLVFGPKKKAATLEGSKSFSKDFMVRHGIPTAAYKEVNSYDEAVEALADFNYPVVVKADGLAAGKGVIIAENKDEAIDALKLLMVDQKMGSAGNKVVLEEFLTGFECSLLCFTDGQTIVPMVSAKDHKQIYDGNKGPNTGGMGTVSPNPFLPEGMDEVFKKDILEPFMAGLKADDMDFRGVIFIGLMIENGKAKVLEFNVRFGDPETQSILLRLDTDLYDIFEACAKKELNKVDVKWKDEQVCTLVLASGGYPGSYPKGLEITGLDSVPEDIVIFHAGTALKDGKIVTNGGRVLNVCAYGKDLAEARAKVYEAAKLIHFDGMYYRQNIGLE